LLSFPSLRVAGTSFVMIGQGGRLSECGQRAVRRVASSGRLSHPPNPAAPGRGFHQAPAASRQARTTRLSLEVARLASNVRTFSPAHPRRAEMRRVPKEHLSLMILQSLLVVVSGARAD
jgi:hypothetical protein